MPSRRRWVRQRCSRAFVGFAFTGLALFAPFALTYSVYAPGAKAPAVLTEERHVLACKGWSGETGAFLNRRLACGDSWHWSDGIGALKIVMYSTGPMSMFLPSDYILRGLTGIFGERILWEPQISFAGPDLLSVPSCLTGILLVPLKTGIPSWIGGKHFRIFAYLICVELFNNRSSRNKTKFPQLRSSLDNSPTSSHRTRE